MSKKKLYAHVVLDRSGSMEDGRDVTISAFNEYVHGLAADPEISSRLSLTIFDSQSIDVIHDNIKAKDAPKLTRETFVPRAMTPLFDAIGRTIAKIDAETRRPDERVALVIQTDGLENHSREFTSTSIKKLLDERRAKGWLVIYLGADHDVFTQAGVLGVNVANTMSYGKLSSSATMQSAQRATKSYAKASTAEAGLSASEFTEDERNKAK